MALAGLSKRIQTGQPHFSEHIKSLECYKVRSQFVNSLMLTTPSNEKFHRTMEYPELEQTHKYHQVQVLACTSDKVLCLAAQGKRMVLLS